jgi:hypothetical protein
MALFVRIALASALFTTPVQAQVAKGHAPSPFQVSEEQKPERSFDIVDYPADTDSSGVKGSKIIAGTELLANTSIGFGMFGEKADRPDHTRSITRDYSVPKSRKAAIGVAFRF